MLISVSSNISVRFARLCVFRGFGDKPHSSSKLSSACSAAPRLGSLGSHSCLPSCLEPRCAPQTCSSFDSGNKPGLFFSHSTSNISCFEKVNTSSTASAAVHLTACEMKCQKESEQRASSHPQMMGSRGQLALSVPWSTYGGGG